MNFFPVFLKKLGFFGPILKEAICHILLAKKLSCS